jgi:L-gulonate 3-dehydrogenase
MKEENRNVAIVGTGLIGRAWAAIFARAGWNVRLTDPHGQTLKAAPGLIRDELHRWRATGWPMIPTARRRG